LTFPFRSCEAILNLEFAQNFIGEVKSAVLDRFFNMTDKELKDIEKDSISKILRDMKEFLKLGMNEEETDKIVEHTQLAMSLKFLKSEYLEKKLKGI
jgi:hypothetical protein